VTAGDVIGYMGHTGYSKKGGQQDMAPDTGYERPAGGGVHAAERLEHAVRIP